MKKTTIAIAILLVVFVAIVLIAVVTDTGDDANINGDTDILAVSGREALSEYITANAVKSYGFDADMAYVLDADLFGEKADVEFYMADDAIVEIAVCFILFDQGADVVYENDYDVPEEVPVYQFTDKDKKVIHTSFEKVKKGFESYIGCTFADYDLVPTQQTVPENTEENFYNGLFVKEYSVRDSSGVLWLLRYEASFGSSAVMIYKFIDETGFEGFIPQVDLTKQN